MKIVERYNRHGALEASTWSKSGGFAGVELMNEWNTLILGFLRNAVLASQHFLGSAYFCDFLGIFLA